MLLLPALGHYTFKILYYHSGMNVTGLERVLELHYFEILKLNSTLEILVLGTLYLF